MVFTLCEYVFCVDSENTVKHKGEANMHICSNFSSGVHEFLKAWLTGA